MKLHRFLVILTIVVGITLVIAVWFFPSNEDFRTENPFWNGIKDISSTTPILPLESLSELPKLPPGSALILIPYLDFTSTELEELNRFVTQGGSLILADDYGCGNQILEYLGLRARFSGQTLLDPLFNHRNQWFPRVSRLSSNSITNGVDNLILNHATCLIKVETSDTIALSSPFSFLDSNGNQAWDEYEPTGPLPVISQHKLDSGQVILISDPSIIINSMNQIESNDTLLQNIAAVTSGLFIDQSHLPPSNLHQSKNLLASIHSLLITPLGTLGLVVLALVITLIPIWHKKSKDA